MNTRTFTRAAIVKIRNPDVWVQRLIRFSWWMPLNLALFLMCHTVHLHYEKKLSLVVTLNPDPNPLWPINGEAAVQVSAKALKFSRSHWFDTFGNWLCVWLWTLNVSICASSGNYVNISHRCCLLELFFIVFQLFKKNVMLFLTSYNILNLHCGNPYKRIMKHFS